MAGIQYTIRNIPQPLDSVLRKRARQTGKSFNQTVIETLHQSIFHTAQPDITQDPNSFDWFFGTAQLDAGFDQAIADQKRIDPRQWQ